VFVDKALLLKPNLILTTTDVDLALMLNKQTKISKKSTGSKASILTIFSCLAMAPLSQGKLTSAAMGTRTP
jgi:hypothetical protein